MATYTFDVFTSLDGFGSATREWGAYWGKQGPELLEHRLRIFDQEQRMVFGPATYRLFAGMFGGDEALDPWVLRMGDMPKVVVSRSMPSDEPMPWPNATRERGDAVDVVALLKKESDIPLRSHGSLSMNRALMTAGLVDRVQVTIFPVITGITGSESIFANAADFDLELIDSRTLDGSLQELTYAPTVHPVPPT